MTSRSPNTPRLNPVFYSSAQLEEIATEFLQQYHVGDTHEVDIELILEKCVGIRILEFRSLKFLHGIEAYITLSRKTIYVDPFLMDLDVNEKRYRFTVAEEAAHSIIHRDLFIGVTTPEEYLALYDRLGGDVYRRMDKDAKRLAGAILTPLEPFQALAAKYFQEFVDNQPAEALHIKMIGKLAEVFNVSQYSAAIRFEQLGLDRRFRP